MYNRLKYKCKECNDISAKSIDELIKKFPRTYKFCNGNLNKFVLLLRKGVYPYEYMDSWERFHETLLPPKQYFYSELNLENISDKDYSHAQKACLKMTNVNLELLTDIDMLLMIESGIRGGMCIHTQVC